MTGLSSREDYHPIDPLSSPKGKLNPDAKTYPVPHLEPMPFLSLTSVRFFQSGKSDVHSKPS
jgi:hypothetical protein